jgi:cobalamin biosynthesis Mg chelatase CobN
MRRPLLAIATAVALAIAIPCISQANNENFLPGGQPLIYGKVTRITSHTVVILTREGESLPMEFDSRTVMSTDLPTGCSVRVEFRLLESGRYLAQRVTPLDRNSSAWSVLTHRIVRSRTRTVSPAVYGGGAQAQENSSTPEEGASSSNVNSTEGAEGTDASVASASNPESERQASTASAVPVILMVALLILGGALVLRWVRRRV